MEYVYQTKLLIDIHEMLSELSKSANAPSELLPIDRLWTREDVCYYLQIEKNTLINRVQKSPGFPRP